MPGAQMAFIGSVACLAVLFGLMLSPQPKGRQAPLMLLCAASQKAPVSTLARRYQADHGAIVQLSYGGSGQLLANLEITRVGDLYPPADDSYIEMARAKGLIDDTVTLARMRAVLAVRRGNPKGIRSLSDLTRPDVTLGMASPEVAAVGAVVKAVLESAGAWDELLPRVQVFKPTVTDVASDLRLGTVDAAFLWNILLPEQTRRSAERPVEPHATFGVT